VVQLVAPDPPPGLEPGPVPTFSVVIPAHNADATIGEALDSLAAQTVAPHEIIVVDDGSTDATQDIARSVEGVQYVRIAHAGVQAARNAGLQRARGDFYAPFDADDIAEPERIERLGEAAALRPDLDLLTTDAWFLQDGRITSRFCESNPFEVQDQRTAILERCFLVQPAMRRERLVLQGGYHPRLQIAEDWDCYLRMLHGGAVAGLVDQPLMRYRLHARAATADRGRTLALRARWLASVPDRVRLTPAQRRLVLTKARGERARAARALAQEALVADAPDARVRLLKLALTRGAGGRVRLAAAAATLAPRSARRRIAKLG
jgi:glycosyltransferase involved in cell wall biosynthesis